MPTCARTRSIASSMMLPTLQRASQPAISRTKRSNRRRALGRVCDFRMKLHAIEAAALVAHGGEGNGVGRGGGREAGGQLVDAVAVTHPDIEDRAAFAVAAVFDVIQEAAAHR